MIPGNIHNNGKSIKNFIKINSNYEYTYVHIQNNVFSVEHTLLIVVTSLHSSIVGHFPLPIYLLSLRNRQFSAFFVLPASLSLMRAPCAEVNIICSKVLPPLWVFPKTTFFFHITESYTTCILL